MKAVLTVNDCGLCFEFKMMMKTAFIERLIKRVRGKIADIILHISCVVKHAMYIRIIATSYD